MHVTPSLFVDGARAAQAPISAVNAWSAIALFAARAMLDRPLEMIAAGQVNMSSMRAGPDVLHRDPATCPLHQSNVGENFAQHTVYNRARTWAIARALT